MFKWFRTIFSLGAPDSACEKSIHLKTEDYTDPIDHVIHEMLLPTLVSQVEPLPDILQEVITLPPAKGDL